MEAFQRLSTCRDYGMSEGPIPWRDSLEYARNCQLDEYAEFAFIKIIETMDVAYLKWQANNKPKGS